MKDTTKLKEIFKEARKKAAEEMLKENGPLVNTMPPAEQPVQATQSEIAAAQAPAEAPAVEDGVTPTDTSAPADPFTPPAPGMIPTGWNYPEDIAAAVAQVTGDVTAAQTAPDANVTNEAVPQPALATPTQVAQEPVQLQVESLSEEEKRMILEYRESLKEKKEEVCPECGKTPCECEKDKMTESEEEKDSEDEEVELEEEAVEEEEKDEDEDEDEEEKDSEGEEDEGEEEEVTDIVETTPEEVEEEEIPEETSIDVTEEEVAPHEEIDPLDYLGKFEAFFDDKPQEEIADLANAFSDAAGFLNYMLSDLPKEDEVTDVDDDGTELVDEDDYEALPDVEDDPFREKMSEQIKYPAGSSPEASEIANEARRREVEQANLVKQYNESAQQRREIINKFREELREARTRNAAEVTSKERLVESRKDRFDSALRGRGTSRLTEAADSDSDSWENNKFLDRYMESKQLDFRALMRDGMLG